MDKVTRPESLLLTEIQVLLAEKRTYFSIMRTGLGVVSVPLVIITFLMATKDYHQVFSYPWLGGTVVVFLIAISLAGVFLSLKSEHKIKKIDQIIKGIERENARVNKIVV